MPVTPAVAADLVRALTGLLRTSRSYSHLRHEQLGASGVAVGVLGRLADGPARSTDLACALGVTASAVSRGVASLEGLGYVARTTDPADGRAQLLELTAAGVTFLADQRGEQARVVAATLDDWDDAEARTALEGFARLDGALAHAVAEMRAGRPSVLSPGLPALPGLPTLEPILTTDDQDTLA